MVFCEKVDNSLDDRLAVVHLLESLKKEDITMEEMEKAGVELQKYGKWALRPLLRRLWREENGDHVSRYVYLLDFFDDELWIDQIVRITLKRDELDDDGKAALLAVLDDYGLDINSPPFSKVLEEISGPLEATLPKLLDKGEAGLIRFMEDFLGYPQESQLVVARYLSKINDPRVLSLLEILLRLDDREVIAETMATLGRIRDGRSASLLRSFDCRGDNELRELACRNLRRLSFLGISPSPPSAALPPVSAYICSVSSIDGTGNRTLWFSRWGTDGRLDVLFMQLHDAKGMVDALGYSDITREKYEKLRREVAGEETLTDIETDYALLLIRDSLSLSRKNGAPLPPEFYVRCCILPAEALVPSPYMPEFPGYDLQRLADAGDLLEQSATLFEEEYFDGWFTADSRLFDLAEEYDLLEKKVAGQNLDKAVECFIDRFIQDKVTHAGERMARRLFLIADLMRRSGRERSLVEKTLAVAANLLQPQHPFRKNPFLRQFALESLKITREAIAEGFDLRLHGWDEEGELWD